jgi:hypothetical protein
MNQTRLTPQPMLNELNGLNGLNRLNKKNDAEIFVRNT